MGVEIFNGGKNENTNSERIKGINKMVYMDMDLYIIVKHTNYITYLLSYENKLLTENSQM